ncbi:acyl-CoA dehydrogenase family protein [Azospirillum thermophilum]|uniref:Acyl-CoA dehydrogenase n=1 Tax=Azospirillum thermophilum TaxID=2202148 RepID=A0A2S2CVA0_9PROT|nr:acyl-CoA dehydrogenase family protein [Azospirillum thermophilum]AWK88335.1 acyl-CoA dehydrogenase [Azospirillum thermophilum]
MLLLEDFRAQREELRDFAMREIAPHAQRIDREERIPAEVIASLREAGVFASGFPAAYGGTAGDDPAADAVRHGLMHEALGMASASAQGLVNVHHMGGFPIARWGTREQKEAWLPRLTSGELLAAIAITEPNVGSQAGAVETRAVREGSDYVITGTKCWITCGQSADLFVLITGSDEGPAAFILPRDTPGLTIEPIRGLLGCRGYMLAKLHLDRCRVPGDRLLGKPGFGVTHVAAAGLDAGRYNLAWGCVGLAQACLDASVAYARSRRQFNAPIGDHQLVQRMITGMATDIHAARLTCWHAGVARGRRDPSAVKEGAMAKYLASRMVNRVANDALQIHGANGCGPDFPLERHYRDARIMEIIEGTSQILEGAIARYVYQEAAP